MHGRARREAARRRKSEWKVNLGNRNSYRSNGSYNEWLQTNHVPYGLAWSAYGIRAVRVDQCARYIFIVFWGGTPVPVWVCVSKSSAICSAYINLRAHHPVWAEILSPEQSPLKLILHSELRRRAASRRALPCPSSSFLVNKDVYNLCSRNCNSSRSRGSWQTTPKGTAWHGLASAYSQLVTITTS